MEVIALQRGEHPLGKWNNIGDKFNYDHKKGTKFPTWMRPTDEKTATRIANEQSKLDAVPAPETAAADNEPVTTVSDDDKAERLKKAREEAEEKEAKAAADAEAELKKQADAAIEAEKAKKAEEAKAEEERLAQEAAEKKAAEDAAKKPAAKKASTKK